MSSSGPHTRAFASWIKRDLVVQVMTLLCFCLLVSRRCSKTCGPSATCARVWLPSWGVEIPLLWVAGLCLSVSSATWPHISSPSQAPQRFHHALGGSEASPHRPQTYLPSSHLSGCAGLAELLSPALLLWPGLAWTSLTSELLHLTHAGPQFLPIASSLF